MDLNENFKEKVDNVLQKFNMENSACKAHYIPINTINSGTVFQKNNI
jgi:hypothetical protein